MAENLHMSSHDTSKWQTLIMSQSFTTLQSWWTWDHMEQADLWHKCTYDNKTNTLMCTSATENGTYTHALWIDMNRNEWWFLLLSARGWVTEVSHVSAVSDWLQSVQALMVLSVILSSISFVTFICQLFITSRRGLFYFSGLSQIVAGKRYLVSMLNTDSAWKKQIFN